MPPRWGLEIFVVRVATRISLLTELRNAARICDVTEVFSLSSPRGGEGGERRSLPLNAPRPNTPHSFLAGRGRKFLVAASCARLPSSFSFAAETI